MEDLKELMSQFREQIEEVKKKVDEVRANKSLIPGEIGANVTLGYRHLEDARMRFGKAIQALDGGTSCYPR